MVKSFQYQNQTPTAEKIVEQVNSKDIKKIYCGFCKAITKHEGIKCKRCE